jgi:hypothetical protein
MNGLTLTDPATGAQIPGEVLLRRNNLNIDMSIGEIIAVLIGILVGLRLLALIGLKLAYHRGWM